MTLSLTDSLTHSLTDWLTDSLSHFWFLTLKSNPRHFWPLRHLMRAMERQEKIHFDKYNLTNTFYKYILRNTFGQIHLDKFISPNTFLRTCLFLCFIVYDVRWGTIHYKSIYSNSLAQQLSWWKPNCFVCVIILKHMRLSLYCHTLFVSFVNLVFSCPEQLNRWPCHWLTHWLTHWVTHWATFDFWH